MTRSCKRSAAPGVTFIWDMMIADRELSKADSKLLAEAHASIARITATMNTGHNRFGSYGDNCRDSIRRWEATIARLTGAA